MSDILLSEFGSFECFGEMALKMNPAQFQKWAIEKLKKNIPFNSSQFVDGVMDFKKMVPCIQRAYLFNQPYRKLENYDLVHKKRLALDQIAQALPSNMGTALAMRDVLGDDAHLWDTPLYHYHSKFFRQEHVLAIGSSFYRDSYRVLSFYREDRGHPFSDEEKTLIEKLWKSFLFGFQLCLERNVYKKRSLPQPYFYGIVNTLGGIVWQECVGSFTEVLKKINKSAVSQNSIRDDKMLKMIFMEPDLGLYERSVWRSEKIMSDLYMVEIHYDENYQHLTEREYMSYYLLQPPMTRRLTHQEVADKLGFPGHSNVNNNYREARRKLDKIPFKSTDLFILNMNKDKMDKKNK